MQHRVLQPFARAPGPLYLLPLFLLLWYALTGGEGWLLGIVGCTAAAVVAVRLAAPRRVRISPYGLLRFAGHFLHRSLEGGVDVAWRALHPGMPLVEGEEWRPLRLAGGHGRTLFIAAACLLPGTLVCRDTGERVLIHSISPDPQEKLDALEMRVARVFRAGEKARS